MAEQYGIGGINLTLVGLTVAATPLTDNILVGGTFPAHTTGDDNTGFGIRVFNALTTGSYNAAFGMDALGFAATLTYCCAFGHNSMSLAANTAGDSCAFGAEALMNVTGPSNTAIGCVSMTTCTTGTLNTAVGSWSLHDLLDGVNNSVLGFYAGERITSGADNTLIGFQCGYRLTTATDNTALGGSALHTCTVFSNNVAIGRYALYNVDQAQNTAVGWGALFTSTTGTRNVAIGFQAGYYETGNDKLFIDNRARTNEADARVKSLIYGIFDAATVNQWLTINGHLVLLLSEVPTGANNAAAAAAGIPVGGLYRANADPSILYIRSA